MQKMQLLDLCIVIFIGTIDMLPSYVEWNAESASNMCILHLQQNDLSGPLLVGVGLPGSPGAITGKEKNVYDEIWKIISMENYLPNSFLASWYFLRIFASKAAYYTMIVMIIILMCATSEDWCNEKLKSNQVFEMKLFNGLLGIYHRAIPTTQKIDFLSVPYK